MKDTRCDECGRLFEGETGLKIHKRVHEKEFEKKLISEGIIEDNKNDRVWFSGGMKVLLILRGDRTTIQLLENLKNNKRTAKENIQDTKRLLKFETDYGVKVEYDGDEDILTFIKKHKR